MFCRANTKLEAIGDKKPKGEAQEAEDPQMSYYPGGHYSQKMLAIAVDSDRNSKLTAGSDSKLLGNVNGKIFKGYCYRLYHEEEELLLDCRNVWRV